MTEPPSASLVLDPIGGPPQRHVLTDVEFDVLWERLGLGATPAVLRLPAPRRARAERREVQRSGSLPGALLGVPPPAPPGPGRGAAAPTSVLEAGLGDARGLRAALIARAVPVAEATPLERMLRAGTGRGRIVALQTGADGVARRVGGVVGVLDGPAGRYLLTRSLGPAGVEWSTVAPVDDRRLHQRVTELLDPAGVG